MSFSVRRAAGEADLAASVAVYNEVLPRYAVTVEESIAWARAADAAVELLAAADGTVVGSAAAAIRHDESEAAFFLLTVLPAARGRGVGSALLAAVSDWAARAHGLEQLETYVVSDDERSFAFAQRRGFRETSREAGLELDVSTFAAATVPPDGVAVSTLAERRDLADGTWDVAAEAIPDIPGDEEWKAPPRERWVEDFLLTPSTPPEAVVVAHAGDEVVGYAKLRIHPDGKSARHGMTAVRPAWRGRGVARALKSAQIEWAKSVGIERLTTTNEVRNAPMRRINEALGYVPAAGRIMLRGPLAGNSV